MALYSRIKFTRAFYQCLYGLFQHSKEERTTMVADCQRLLSVCNEMLFVMHNSVNMGVQSSDPSK